MAASAPGGSAVRTVIEANTRVDVHNDGRRRELRPSPAMCRLRRDSVPTSAPDLPIGAQGSVSHPGAMLGAAKRKGWGGDWGRPVSDRPDEFVVTHPRDARSVTDDDVLRAAANEGFDLHERLAAHTGEEAWGWHRGDDDRGLASSTPACDLVDGRLSPTCRRVRVAELHQSGRSVAERVRPTRPPS